MASLVVAYQGIAKHDFDEIQAFRRVDDVMYYRVVKHHFAIALPVFDWDNAPAQSETSCQLARAIREGI
jgi:hypothetical protein